LLMRSLFQKAYRIGLSNLVRPRGGDCSWQRLRLPLIFIFHVCGSRGHRHSTLDLSSSPGSGLAGRQGLSRRPLFGSNHCEYRSKLAVKPRLCYSILYIFIQFDRECEP
jgi:hypothetical protein